MCETKSISSATDHLRQLYLNPEKVPSLWFSPRTDHLLPPVVVKIVSILAKRPKDLWIAPDVQFLSKVMVLACDPAVEEEGAGQNLGAKRWLSVFSKSLASLPPDLGPFSLWLLTFTKPHDTLIKSALRILDDSLIMAGYQAKRYRNRSLCRLRRQLLDFDVACGRDFNRKLKDTKKCGHLCFGCVAWPSYILLRGTQMALGLRRRLR